MADGSLTPDPVENIYSGVVSLRHSRLVIFLGKLNNLLHCLATGASLTACLHFCNQTPTDWYSKKQVTVETATYASELVETATYGSEFVAAKTTTGQIMDLRYTLRYLGVPIKSKFYMSGDNRYVVTRATLPQHSGIPQGQGSHSCQNH